MSNNQKPLKNGSGTKHVAFLEVSDLDSSLFLLSFFLKHFWLCPAACVTLVPWPGIQLASLALESRVLTTGLLEKSPDSSFYDCRLHYGHRSLQFPRTQRMGTTTWETAGKVTTVCWLLFYQCEGPFAQLAPSGPTQWRNFKLCAYVISILPEVSKLQGTLTESQWTSWKIHSLGSILSGWGVETQRKNSQLATCKEPRVHLLNPFLSIAAQKCLKFYFYFLPKYTHAEGNCGLSAEGGHRFQFGKHMLEPVTDTIGLTQKDPLDSRVTFTFLCHKASLFPSRVNFQSCFSFTHDLILPHNLVRQPRQTDREQLLARELLTDSRPGVASRSLFLALATVFVGMGWLLS